MNPAFFIALVIGTDYIYVIKNTTACHCERQRREAIEAF